MIKLIPYPKQIYRMLHCKWFEPRSISSSYSVIVRVKVVLACYRMLVYKRDLPIANSDFLDSQILRLGLS